MTATSVNMAPSATAATRPIRGKAQGSNEHPSHIRMDRAAGGGIARRGIDARARDAGRRGRRAADHRAVRSSVDRLRTRWRAPRSAVRVLPLERDLQGHAEELRRLPYHGFDVQRDAEERGA